MSGTVEKHTIILIPARLSAIQMAYKQNPAWELYPLLYLSRNALLMRQIRKGILKKVRFIDIGEQLQSVARKSRQDYIDYIGDLSCTYNSLSWWLTSVSEKNPFTSRVFLYLCYLKVMEQECAAHENVVVICDSGSLMDAIGDSFGARADLSISVYGSRSPVFSGTVRRFRGLWKKTVFAVRFLLRIGIAKFFAVIHRWKNPGDAPDEVFLHSWTDGRSFSSTSGYKDTYFGQLGDRIQKQYPRFVIISNVLPTWFYPKAVAGLLKYGNRIHLIEQYLTFFDVFRALYTVNVQLPEITIVPLFGNLNPLAIIRGEIDADRTASSRSELSLLHYCAGKRLGRNPHARAVFYTFENHMWEKMFITGIREVNARCRLIGYAHSIVSPGYLFYSLASAEQSIAPLPDYILVNGELAQQRLIDAGFDDAVIHVCGAFRYEDLKNRSRRLSALRGKKTILIIPTSEIDEIIELIDLAVLALQDITDVAIRIKLHPNTPVKTILPLYQDLPENFSFTFEPVDTLLPLMDLVLVTESAASIEALALHIPVLHIRSGIRIDMNAFEGIDCIPSAANPDDIKTRAHELLKEPNIAPDQYDQLVRAFFAPVDEAVITKILMTPQNNE
jgi:UDP-N-acetylglucosamine 2-epimerase